MYYNYTGIETMTGLFSFFNTVTNNWFWTLMLFATFVTVFLILSRWNPEDAALASGFICATFSIILRVAGLVGNEIVVMFMLGTALLGAFKLFFKQN